MVPEIHVDLFHISYEIHWILQFRENSRKNIKISLKLHTLNLVSVDIYIYRHDGMTTPRDILYRKRLANFCDRFDLIMTVNILGYLK